MFVGVILLSGGCLLVLVGFSLAILHVVTAPPRYGRQIRMDSEKPPGFNPRPGPIGAALICMHRGHAVAGGRIPGNQLELGLPSAGILIAGRAADNGHPHIFSTGDSRLTCNREKPSTSSPAG